MTVKVQDYLVNGQFSIVGKFNFWQLNENKGSYKYAEKSLLGKIREDYSYGSISKAFEAFGGGLDLNLSNELKNMEKVVNKDNVNEEKKVENKKEPERNNDFENIDDDEVEVKEAKESTLKNTAIPYFEILDEALRTEEKDENNKDNKNNESGVEQLPSTIYKSATVSFEKNKNLQINFTNEEASSGDVVVKPEEVLKNIFIKEIRGQKYYLTSISSGKDGGAFNINIKYPNHNDDDKLEFKAVVNDCHGRRNKKIHNIAELQNFLGWEEGKTHNHPVVLRYTSEKAIESHTYKEATDDAIFQDFFKLSTNNNIS